MNFSEALSFAFEDEEWVKKLAIGGAISFIGMFAGLIFITCFFTTGYYLMVMRRVIQQEELPLAEWDDLGKIFVEGIQGVLIWLAWFLGIGLITAFLIVFFAINDSTSDGLKAMQIVSVSLTGLMSFQVFSSISLLIFAKSNEFMKSFNPAEIAKCFKDDFGALFAIIIFSMVLNLFLFVGGLGVLSPFLNFWGMLVQGHLLAQLARRQVPVEAVAAV